jgi:hypothetical protein
VLELLIAVVAVALLALASVWADRRFRQADRLPMQWSVAGRINWTAPRRAALAFTPGLGALVLGAVAISVLTSGEPRPGQEDLGAPVVLVIGAAFLGLHGLHLWLIDRSLR